MEPLKSIKNQLKKIPLDQITIDQIGKSVSNNQFDEACELILKNIPQENAIAILDTLGICTDSQKRLEQILQNVINSSSHPSVSRSRSGSMSPTTDGSTSNDSISSVELINPQVNTGKTESSGYVSPTTDSDLSDEELFS